MKEQASAGDDDLRSGAFLIPVNKEFRRIVVSAVPLFMWLGYWAMIPWGMIFGCAMVYAFKIEKVKKENDVHTYREIVAFSEGKLLDDIQKQRELGKRPYQKILLVIGCATISFVVCIIIGLIMNFFLN